MKHIKKFTRIKKPQKPLKEKQAYFILTAFYLHRKKLTIENYSYMYSDILGFLQQPTKPRKLFNYTLFKKRLKQFLLNSHFCLFVCFKLLQATVCQKTHQKHVGQNYKI